MRLKYKRLAPLSNKFAVPTNYLSSSLIVYLREMLFSRYTSDEISNAKSHYSQAEKVGSWQQIHPFICRVI